MTQAMEDTIFFFNGSVHLHGISGVIFEDKTDNCATNISIDGFLQTKSSLFLHMMNFTRMAWQTTTSQDWVKSRWQKSVHQG